MVTSELASTPPNVDCKEHVSRIKFYMLTCNPCSGGVVRACDSRPTINGPLVDAWSELLCDVKLDVSALSPLCSIANIIVLDNGIRVTPTLFLSEPRLAQVTLATPHEDIDMLFMNVFLRVVERMPNKTHLGVQATRVGSVMWVTVTFLNLHPSDDIESTRGTIVAFDDDSQ